MIYCETHTNELSSPSKIFIYLFLKTSPFASALATNVVERSGGFRKGPCK